MRERQVWSLGQEDLLEKGMATYSSIPAWRIPWTEETMGFSPWIGKESDMTEQPTLVLGRAALKESGQQEGPEFPPGQGRRISAVGWGSRSQCPLQRLCTWPAHTSWIEGPPRSLFIQLEELGCSYHSRFSPGTRVWSASLQFSMWGTLWASQTRLSTKEKRLDFILFPRF